MHRDEGVIYYGDYCELGLTSIPLKSKEKNSSLWLALYNLWFYSGVTTPGLGAVAPETFPSKLEFDTLSPETSF